MVMRVSGGLVVSFVLLVGAGGCAGEISGTPPADGGGDSGNGVGSSNGAGSTNGTGGNGRGGASGNAGSPSGGATTAPPVPLPQGVGAAELIPARIRRLTNAEYDATVRVLTGTQVAPAQNFAPDLRQSDFTFNDAQDVGPVLAKQLSAAAATLAAEVKANAQNRAPCHNPAQAKTCAQSFIEKFGAQTYRRPLSAEEKAALLTVYDTGAEGATYADGIELVVNALLQSAGFLYLTEIGDKPPGTATIGLTPHELASSLSYLLLGSPPDQQLIDAAVAGKLDTPEGRATEMQRLIGTPVTKEKAGRLVGVLREWLGIDRIGQTAKDAGVYTKYQDYKAAFERESNDFLSAVLTQPTGTVGELLGADWTQADGTLGAFYGGTGQGRVTLPKRRGVLNQGAFLSVYAHASESGPVLRGVAIARRIACLNVPSPTTLNINVVPPAPDPSKTTRERFSVHAADAACAGCHANIDPFGFSFEQYDGMGAFRSKEGNNDVNSATTVAVGADFDGTYANSDELAVALSKSASVRECFAKHMFRAAAARSDATVKASEDAFMKAWHALPAAEQGNILQTVMTFVKSPLFQYRRAE